MNIKHLFLTLGAFALMIAPLKASAFGLFDGGMLEGIADECTCSGGMTIRVSSYVDNSSHVYLYQMGATQLDMNYDIMSSGGYFLTTLEPFAECLVYEGEDCDSSSQNPEGTFLEVGTSMKLDKNSFMALFKKMPGMLQPSNAFSRALMSVSLPTHL